MRTCQKAERSPGVLERLRAKQLHALLVVRKIVAVHVFFYRPISNLDTPVEETISLGLTNLDQ